MNVTRDASAAIVSNHIMLKSFLQYGAHATANDTGTGFYISPEYARRSGPHQISISGDSVRVYMFHNTRVPAAWSTL